MSKVRVYELAKELGVESKVVLAKLAELGEFVRSASSTVEAPVVRKLKDAMPAAPAADAKPKRATKKAAAPKEEAPPAAEDAAVVAVEAVVEAPAVPATPEPAPPAPAPPPAPPGHSPLGARRGRARARGAGPAGGGTADFGARAAMQQTPGNTDSGCEWTTTRQAGPRS